MRIKPEYVRVWSRLCAVWDATSVETRLSLNLAKPVAVAVRSQVAQDFLAGESAAFRAELQIQNDVDYDARMADWTKGKQESVTPQEFHQ